MNGKVFSSGCHFIWTQWRKTEHAEYLRRVKEERDKLRRLETDGKLMNETVLPLAHVPTLMYNRLDDNYHLSNKKALFRHVSNYYSAMGVDPFQAAIPLTFHVKSPDGSDTEFSKFTKAYDQFGRSDDANIWIIKPGENSNRGTGIQVA